MRALVIMHVANEGPGTLGAYLAEQGVKLDYVLMNHDNLPPRSADGYAAVISMGGPMSAAGPSLPPFLAAELDLLRSAIGEGLPVLGICLGAQLIARALGARVMKAPEPEVGWRRVALTAAGAEDALFQGIDAEFDVLQWHEDTFELPAGARLLVRGDRCTNQSFCYNNARALQFHLEADGKMLADWTSESPALLPILDQHRHYQPPLDLTARRFYANFMALLQNRSAAQASGPAARPSGEINDGSNF